MTVALITGILSVLSVIVEALLSRDAKKKRKDSKLDEAFAEKDTDFIATELANYHRMLKEKNSNITRQQKDN